MNLFEDQNNLKEVDAESAVGVENIDALDSALKILKLIYWLMFIYLTMQGLGELVEVFSQLI